MVVLFVQTTVLLSLIECLRCYLNSYNLDLSIQLTMAYLFDTESDDERHGYGSLGGSADRPSLTQQRARDGGRAVGASSNHSSSISHGSSMQLQARGSDRQNGAPLRADDGIVIID